MSIAHRFIYSNSSDCIEKLRNLDGCPSMRIWLGNVKKELPDIDWADGDCTSSTRAALRLLP